AFLLNQFCLACVFWYVDKLIFKRHFKETLREFFRFPRIRHAFTLKDQCAMLNREFSDLRTALSGNEENPERWVHAFVDLVHAVEMTEMVLREKHINIDAAIEQIREENRKKGLYGSESTKTVRSRRRRSGDFLDAVQKGCVIADGAMGTYLVQKGIDHTTCREYLNCTNPDIIAAVHREYITAGAQLIETNTFGANRVKLAKYGLADKTVAINIEGARLAREAAGDSVFVAGSIGPLGRLIMPYGNVTLADAHAASREQIRALVEGGVDIIMIETMTSLLEAREAILMCQEVCDLPIVCQMSFTSDGTTLHGDGLLEALEQLQAAGATLVGMNCSLGPEEMFQLMQQMPGRFHSILSVQPNAGMPREKNGVITYPTGPAYFGRYASLFRQHGARLIGGCCGTTPDHIRAIARALLETTPAIQPVDAEAEPRASSSSFLVQPSPASSWFGQKPFVTVEVSPPKDIQVEQTLQAVGRLMEAGADAINVTENPMARIHMSSLAFCSLVKQRFPIKILLHFTTRDRNLLAVRSDLLGAAAIGVDGILALKGDPASIGDIPYASSVYDVSTVGLIKIISDMNAGHVWQTHNINTTRFLIAVGANPCASDLDVEIERLCTKIEAGAQCVITQPIYDIGVLEQFKHRIDAFHIPVILGLLPFKNSRQAEYLHHEVPGIVIPEHLRQCLRDCTGDDAARKGFDYAVSLIQETAGLVNGYYLMPPQNYMQQTIQLIAAIKSTPKI
ncbi:MAG: bifunctional homocysteine S-methyltransferase/methylenetetrahydrofolate reductase, partial [Desulfobacterota bacterium]|nr:bifunctional homocysteine S-methyltransferase/methylenetetrahydrofolate reductase [Thermodesulfobacteriota bacterium]